MDILKVVNLTKIYSKTQQVGIKNLNFAVKEGSFHAFIGENGSGKTTTIKSIIGAYTNWSGQILIDEIDNSLAISKKNLGYVPENAIFPKELNTMDYLMSLGQLSNIPKNKLKTRIEEMLAKMQISDLAKKHPYNFSSGQKKKILLIQALIHDPKLIILDEPATNLDPTARFELFKILKTLQEQGKTIFISSHILSEIDKYADSLTLLHKGEVVYTGEKTKSLEEIYYEKIL